MQRISVSSSNVSSVGWENRVLEVEFRGGSLYQYFDVPTLTFQDLLRSTSIGGFLAKYIKPCYRARKVK